MDFFAAIRYIWSPSSKHAVSKGAHKHNLAKNQIKLVLLTNKFTFWYHKVVLENWEYLQNKSACNNFLKLFFARLFANWFSHVLRPNKYFKQLLQADLAWQIPKIIKFSFVYLMLFFVVVAVVETKKICKVWQVLDCASLM